MEAVLQEPVLCLDEKILRAAPAMDDETRIKRHANLIGSRVFLTNLPGNITEERVEKFISKFGEVKYVTTIRKNSMNVPFCCVTLKNAAQAQILLSHRILQFKRHYIKVKAFSTKDQRRAARYVPSGGSSEYGEDDIADDMYGHGLDQQYLEFDQNQEEISNTQKRKLKIKKAKEVQHFLMEQEWFHHKFQHPQHLIPKSSPSSNLFNFGANREHQNGGMELNIFSDTEGIPKKNRVRFTPSKRTSGRRKILPISNARQHPFRENVNICPFWSTLTNESSFSLSPTISRGHFAGSCSTFPAWNQTNSKDWFRRVVFLKRSGIPTTWSLACV